MFLGFRVWGFGAQGFGLVTSGKSQSYFGIPSIRNDLLRDAQGTGSPGSDTFY